VTRGVHEAESPLKLGLSITVGAYICNTVTLGLITARALVDGRVGVS
jgi:hypothetical protein